MQLWQYCLLIAERSLYMFRTLSASIIRSTKNCSRLPRQPTLDVLTGYISSRPMTCASGCYYSFVLLMMDAESVRNM